MHTDDLAERLAAPTPTPGGGAAAARVGCYACALVRMSTGITLGKLSPEESGHAPALRSALDDATRLFAGFRALEAADVAAFQTYLAARRMPRETEDEKRRRGLATMEALSRATDVPLQMAEAALEALLLVERILALGAAVKLRAPGDLHASVELAEATFRIAAGNARENLGGLDAATARDAGARLEATSRRFEEAFARLRAPHAGRGA